MAKATEVGQDHAGEHSHPASDGHHGAGEHGTHDVHAHDAHAGHGGHDAHAGHGGHDKHAGHDPEMFRRKFWLSLALTLPVVATSDMIMEWFGYSLDFPGMSQMTVVMPSSLISSRKFV